MSEVVTRVAKAMAESAGFCWENCAQSQWERDARAGIIAMREPTEAMINSPMARCYNVGPYSDKEVRRIFSAMIDTALAVPSDQRGTQ